MFEQVATSIAALLGLGVIGFWAIRGGIVEEVALRSLSRMVIDIALPAMVFTNLVTSLSWSVLRDGWRYPLAWAGLIAVAAGLGRIAARWSSFPREFQVSLLGHNAIFIPLAVLQTTSLGSPDALNRLFLFSAFHIPALVLLIPRYFARGRARAAREGAAQSAAGDDDPVILRPASAGLDWWKLVNPPLIATVAGCLLTLLGIAHRVPRWVVVAGQMLGQATMPLVMLVLGGNLYLDLRHRQTVVWGEALGFAAAKLIGLPLAALAAVRFFGLEGDLALLLVLQASTSPLVMVPILLERAGGRRDIANQYLAFSLLASVVTIPLVVECFARSR